MTDQKNESPVHRRFYEYEAVKELKEPETLSDDSFAVSQMDRALENLRVRHLPFRSTSLEEINELERLRLAIVAAVTSDPALADYYAEAWLGKPAAAASGSEGPPYRHIAVRQLHLMERAFYLLQLHLFANAPQNGGWMNLFRRWGASPRFNALFDELARTLTQEFCRFYHLYIRDLPPSLSDRCAELSDEDSGKRSKSRVDEDQDEAPIHHPWLRKPGQRGQGLFMDSGLVEASPPAGSEGVRDESGTREGHERSSDQDQSSGEDGSRST